MGYHSEDEGHFYDSIQQYRKPEQKFDTPFFIIRHGSDIDNLRTFLSSARFDDIDWGIDKANNPLCRIGLKQSNSRYPKRVATVCVKQFKLHDSTKATIENART